MDITQNHLRSWRILVVDIALPVSTLGYTEITRTRRP